MGPAGVRHSVICVPVCTSASAQMGCYVPLLAPGFCDIQWGAAGRQKNMEPCGQDSTQAKKPQSVVRHPRSNVFSSP